MIENRAINTSMGKAYFNDYTTNTITSYEPNLLYNWPLYYPNLPDRREISQVKRKNILDEIKKEYEYEKEIEKEEKKMAKVSKRGLYQVILVDPKEGKIIFNEFIICSKPEDVLLEANAGEVIKKKNLAVADVDKIINYLGEIRRTKKNKDGIVELLEEDREAAEQ